jgi:hypothetical protein
MQKILFKILSAFLILLAVVAGLCLLGIWLTGGYNQFIVFLQKQKILGADALN